MDRTTRTTDTDPTEKDRRSATQWLWVVATLAGIWALSPLVSTLISLATGDHVTLPLSPPETLPRPGDVEYRSLHASVPADAIGDSAATFLGWGTALQALAVLVMLVVVTMVGNSMRPGRTLAGRRAIVLAVVAVAASAVGLVGTNLVAVAGTDACEQLYGACVQNDGWNDPLARVFQVTGLALAGLIALVRSETRARTATEGLV